MTLTLKDYFSKYYVLLQYFFYKNYHSSTKVEIGMVMQASKLGAQDIEAKGSVQD